MKKTYALALVPFALSMLGADDCALTQIGQPVPRTSAPTSPAKPYCNADPPVGCAVVCVAVDDVELTNACSDIGASDRTNQFVKDLNAVVAALHAQGMDACNASQVGMASVTPCQDGLAPIEWANQDPENCTPPPAGCIVVTP